MFPDQINSIRILKNHDHFFNRKIKFEFCFEQKNNFRWNLNFKTILKLRSTNIKLIFYFNNKIIFLN